MGSVSFDASGEVGARDRRLIMQVVDHWEALRGKRPFPSITEWEFDAVAGLSANSFLIAIDRKNVAASRLKFMGAALVRDCRSDLSGQAVGAVPRGTLMSRLTDHYLQVIANRCPLGFEAEFSPVPGQTTLYRGVMLPFSGDETTIDHVLGVINGRKEGARLMAPKTPALDIPPVPLEPTLFERLRQCRAGAYNLQDAEDRAINALHAALRDAYAFALKGEEMPETFKKLADGNGVDMGGGTMLTALRLVFGLHYDAGKLNVFRAALQQARRDEQTPSTLTAYLEGRRGGIAGCARVEPIEAAGLLALNAAARR